MITMMMSINNVLDQYLSGLLLKQFSLLADTT